MLHKISVLLLVAVALLVLPSTIVAQSTLDSIARVAITRNLSLKQSRELVRQADAGVKQARGLFLPSLGVEARYSELNGVVNIGDFINPAYAALNQLTGTNRFPTNVDATLPLKQESKLRTTLPLFNGALYANLDAARAVQGLRGAERGAALRRLDAESRIAYLNWARADRAVAIWDAAMKALDENTRASQCLVDAGTATPDAVLRARAARADAWQQRADAVRIRDAALGAYNLLLDQPADAAAPALDDAALPSPPVITLADALASATHREEWTMANAAITGARAQGRVATSAFMPSLSLAADYGVQGNRFDFDRNHDVATVSVVAQWNLFSGGQDAARRDAADAAERSGEYRRAELDRQISLDVRTAFDAVATSREALAAADARVAAASAAFTLIDKRYTEGMAPYYEWSDAQSQLTSARLNQLLARYSLAARGIDLERAAALRTLPTN